MFLIHTIILFFSLVFSQELITPSKDRIKLRLAKTPDEQNQGLSGLKDNEFKDDEGMLFIYKSEAKRTFWMPNTFFNLDIYFLDKDFKIKFMEKNVPHHPGYSQSPTIYVTKSYLSWYVLEMKSSSKISKKLKVNDVLIFNGNL